MDGAEPTNSPYAMAKLTSMKSEERSTTKMEIK